MTLETNVYGILGYGYVGRGTHLGLLDNQPVSIHDTNLGTQRTNLKDCQVVFVCIPTSTDNDIDVLVSEIESLIKQNPKVQIVIRSTLPLGTSKMIEERLGAGIIYIPEFLRERFWEEDCKRRPLIIGHNQSKIPEWLGNESYVECSLTEAELIKMFSNSFAVMRIAFANLFYDLSQAHGSDYDKIKKAYFQVAHDQTYMEVPGHDGTRGFGGKCLPKDLDFLIDSLDQKDLDSGWFKNIRDLNKKWQKKF